MKQLNAQQKHDILVHYQSRRAGETASSILAAHGVSVGLSTFFLWQQQWDGTPHSLQHKAVSGRPRALSSRQVQQYVRPPILRANRAHKAVHYSKLLPSIQARTGKQLSLQTLRRYGREELGAKQRRGKKRTREELSAEMCEEIAQVRRKLQRIGIGHILFLDETLKREGDADNYSIFLPGEPPLIETSTTSSYAARYDMIACCNGQTVLPPIIYAPKERGKGVNQDMLLEFIRNLLAQAAGALDQYPLLLLLDRATIHSEAKIMPEFHDWGCQELTEVIRIPTASAKRLSPLDNSLFNLWRQRVLAGPPLTKGNIKQRMSDAWNSITSAELRAQYRNCGLLRHQDVYFDCPNPAAHKHGN